MQNLKKYELGNGETILIELQDDSIQGSQTAGLGDKFVKSVSSISELCKPVTQLVVELRDSISQKLLGSDEIVLEFGIKVGVDAGVIIAKSQIEGNFKITVKWKNDNKPNG